MGYPAAGMRNYLTRLGWAHLDAEIFSTKRKLVAGENFSIEWVPGVGTVSYLNGKQQGEPVKEPEFFHTLMRIWLGNVPADALLKDALLGKPTVSREVVVN